MPERKTLKEDLFYRGSSANLPRLHTCENKSPVLGFLVNLPSHYNGTSILVLGKCGVQIPNKNNIYDVPIIVVDTNASPVLGLVLICTSYKEF